MKPKKQVFCHPAIYQPVTSLPPPRHQCPPASHQSTNQSTPHPSPIC
ncbi:MAG: hypothetical protein Q6373_026055 [Candidatus Sigynarchaeota archaeon]